MISQETILEILRDACRAPSADNTQPWRFVVQNDTIRVVNTGDQTESIFNYKQMVNYTSLGACIENLRISAEAHGYQIDLRFFPDLSDKLVIAEAVLSPNASAKNELFSYIAQRGTNRKPYLPKQIELQKIEELASLAKNSESRIVFISNDTEVKAIARTVSTGEKIALENKSIHDFLFNHVTWTKTEDEKKHGFFIDTFEFASPQKVAFKLFRNWNILRLFLPFGIAGMIAKDVAKVHATSAVFGAILMPRRQGENYIESGMLFERLWLTATKLGLALQPTTGLNFFAMPVLDNNFFDLNESSIQLIPERYGELSKQFGLSTNETITIVFRLGYADAPSAMTTRFEPSITWLSIDTKD